MNYWFLFEFLGGNVFRTELNSFGSPKFINSFKRDIVSVHSVNEDFSFVVDEDNGRDHLMT